MKYLPFSHAVLRRFARWGTEEETLHTCLGDGGMIWPRDRSERWLAATAHVAGVLGISIVGWAAAAAISWAILLLRGRSAYVAAHAGQAALYQLAVLGIDTLALSWFVSGFLYFAGDIPGLPRLRLGDIGEPLLTISSIVWGVSGLLLPVWHVVTVVYAIIGAARVATNRPFWYPIIGQRIRRQLPAVARPVRPAATTSPPEDAAEAPV